MTTPTVPVPYIIDAGDQEKQKEELAMLEGHDADIPGGQGDGTEAIASKERDTSPSPAESSDTKATDEEQGKISISNKEARDHGTEEISNPYIVFWDGPDDPENPVNWKESLKWANVAAISAITFIT